MPERLKTILIVSLVSVVVWLFAEAASVGQTEELVAIKFTSAGVERLIWVDDPSWDGEVTVQLRGSRAAIAAARRSLDSPLEIEPGVAGMRTSSGPVDLQSVISAHEVVRQTGVSIVDVRPAIVDVVIKDLATRNIPVRPVVEGVEIEGEALASPDSVSVRAPVELWSRFDGAVAPAVASLEPRQVESLPASGQVNPTARITLPPGLAGERGVELLTQSVTLTFSIRTRYTTEPYSAVPVLVVTPPVEWNDWIVSIHPDDQFIAVELRAPTAVIESMRNAGDRPIALLYLSSDDLSRPVPSKVVNIMLLRQDGSIVPLPEGVTKTSPTSAVRFTVEPRVSS